VDQLKVAVLGVGLIGGSIGLACRARAGAHVTGWDVDPGARERARERGAIDEAVTEIPVVVDGADIVFAAVPVSQLVPTVKVALTWAGPETIVTDVGSTKREIIEAISDRRFIGGHPLAGSELSGVTHAREDLFEGARWFLCDGDGACAGAGDAGASREGRKRLEDLIATFGAEPVTIDAGVHDRLMATVSQLPHVLANLLVAQASGEGEGMDVGDDSRSPIVGPSFRDATRVAGSNSAIWTDIYMSNREALLAAIDELIPRLERVRVLLREGDAEALTEWNEQARAQRKAVLGEAAGGADRP
jgi:prephenate dehydrogenase